MSPALGSQSLGAGVRVLVLYRAEGRIDTRVYDWLTWFLMGAGSRPDKKTYVAIKGVVFDVTGNESYAAEKGPYRGMYIERCSAQYRTCRHNLCSLQKEVMSDRYRPVFWLVCHFLGHLLSRHCPCILVPPCSAPLRSCFSFPLLSTM